MGGLRPSGLHINKPVVLGVLAIFISCILLYRFVWMGSGIAFSMGSIKVESKNSSPSSTIVHEGMQDNGYKIAEDGTTSLNASHLPVPPMMDNAAAKEIIRKTDTFSVELSGKKLDVLVEQLVKASGKPRHDILFLHGAKFSSKTWLDMQALHLVAFWGYRAVAVNLPAVDDSQTENFLPALISKLSMNKPVVISPSYSGRFSLPFLFKEPEKSLEKAAAFVPIAPMGVDQFTMQYAKSQIPALIVYGTKDPMGTSSVKNLRLLPKAIVAPIEGAKHACYLDDPKSFFKVLYAFLERLKL